MNKMLKEDNQAAITEPDTGLIALTIALNLLKIPAKADELKRNVAALDVFGVSEILQGAELCDAKAQHIETTISRIEKLPTPFIAVTKNNKFIVITRVKDGQVLLSDPLQSSSQSIPIEEFEQSWRRDIVLIKAESHKKKFCFDLHWFWPSLSQYRSAFSNVLVASFLIQVFALITPLFTMIIIDKVLTTSGYNTLNVLALGLAAMAIFDFIIGSLRAHVLGNLTNRMDAELMSKLFKHLLRLPMSFFSSRKTGDTVSRIKELEVIRNFFSGPALTSVVDFPFTAVFIVVMYWFSPLLSFIVVIAVISLLLLYGVMGGHLRNRIREKAQANSDNQSFLVEGVASVEMLKSLSVEPHLQRQWEDLVVKNSRVSVETEQLNQLLGQAAGFINKVTIALALWLGARAVLQGDMTAGQLIGFNMMISRVLSPAMRIAQLFQHIQQSQVSVQRIKEIFDTQTECDEANPAKGLPAIKGDIKFENVSFAYDGEHKTVENLSFHINPGEVIGITGVSGSGKSTLIRLLQRLYLPQQGRILVDGINIAQIDPTWLRRQIGVVSQENILLNRSIRENIVITDPGMPMEKIQAAARLAGADEFIRALPEAYNTVVGERGAMLSMGQRQRIAMARALVNNPRLLILDEATSSLDSKAENKILLNMQNIVKGRTVIIIAHRLSTLAKANRVMTLEQGKLVEFKPIKELMMDQGHFSDLYNAQVSLSAQAV
jgi:ATP-binding cassette, subfamily B, bacterial HlyB/CyaB